MSMPVEDSNLFITGCKYIVRLVQIYVLCLMGSDKIILLGTSVISVQWTTGKWDTSTKWYTFQKHI